MNSKQKKTTFKIVTIGLSLLLFGLSMFQNAYYIGDHVDSIGSFGLFAFLFGWMNLSESGISWIANTLFLVSIVKHWKGQVMQSIIYAGIAVIFSFIFLLFNYVIVNEAGSLEKITGYGFGYYFWVSSVTINFIAVIIEYIISKKIRDKQQQQLVLMPRQSDKLLALIAVRWIKQDRYNK